MATNGRARRRARRPFFTRNAALLVCGLLGVGCLVVAYVMTVAR